MASAAAVAANASAPPIPNDLGEDKEITGAVHSADSPPALPGTADDEDDEDVDDDLGDDLFGDDGDEEPALEEEPETTHRELDDEDLDSGDDLGRNDRVVSAQAEEVEEQEQVELAVSDLSLARHAVPDPSDNELYLTKVPDFLGIEPKAFIKEQWQPPEAEHRQKVPSANFSTYRTTQTTLRWRYSPSDPTKVQSNARILRWSDGSLTLQLGSDPMTQYEIDGKPLAPPQRNPIKPTPVSKRDVKGGPTRYNPDEDTHTFLSAPHPTQQVLRITNKFTTALTVKASASAADDALEKLQESLAKAAAMRRGGDIDGGVQIANLTEDPEKKKKEAELAEKEKERVQRAKERAEERRAEKNAEGLGRAGARNKTYNGNLGTMELEGEGGRGARRGGRGHGKPKAKRDYDDDDDDEDEDFRHKRSREDDYDEEDDFIARSDEEEDVGEDDEDEDEGMGDVEERPVRRASPKRPRPSQAKGDDDEDEDVQAGPAGKRRRMVIDDDEDE
ncbi:hypothetical protein K490DRAFT_72718 [Saccharata proteae CBS 121410]|uniref:Leo1-domain-containing protein n=1 Tax=Saccharata proteae CBS 121410 TaxID=1314787 RepID=A0A6A5YBR5_9PEZI|nr:hypothetical protein K490DRAFT_72718 [Saccharata proteae CBS 121410]